MPGKLLKFLLAISIACLLSLTAYNTYLYLTKVRDLQNSLIALQNDKHSGPQGISGPIGLTGPQGLQGYSGIPGPQGLPGTQGQQGIQGIAGINGVKGDTGDRGAQGDQGPAGPQGDPGSNGREVEFRCNPQNDDYQYRYVGDDNWQTIQSNSNSCKSGVL